MKKDDILNASRKEHKNKDLAEIEVIYQAGSHAGRVGALVCCLLSLLSSMLAHTMIYSPWVIYFSILSTDTPCPGDRANKADIFDHQGSPEVL